MRWHMMFRPRPSKFSFNCLADEEKIENSPKIYISLNKQLSKLGWIRGPIRLDIYGSTGQDKHKNQIIANINYHQNLMSIYNERKWNQIISELNKLTCSSQDKI